MPRGIWTGFISFGLVNIPVVMVSAVHENNVAFHMLHDQDNARLQRKMVCSLDGQEVHPEHITKGYQIGDEYVPIQQAELDALAPDKSKSMEISDFVDLKQIDPVFFDRPYYLLPDRNAAKPYALLVEAMEKTQKVGIARFVMRGKEYLGALRVVEGIICLETMRFNDEVVAPNKAGPATEHPEINDRELKAAEQLIETLSTKFKPDSYHDQYRQRVLAMIEKKAKGEKFSAPAAITAKKAPASDLMAALEASIARSKEKKPAAAAPRRRKSA